MNRLLVIRSVLLFIVLETAALTSVFWFSSRQQQAYLADEYTVFATNYRSVLETSEVLSKALFVEILNKQPVITLVSQAVHADKALQAQLRGELARHVQSTYRTLLQYNLNQLHFHLPDVSSFLRMHRPGIFGDSLVKVRPAVVLANQRREYVSGFEIGRHEAGIRFIFPLFDQSTFIGTVETSISYNRFHEQLTNRFPGDYSLLIKRSLVAERVVDKEKLALVPSPFSSQLMQEKDSGTSQPYRIPSARISEIASSITAKLRPLLDNNNPLHFAVATGGQTYAVYLMPLTNVAGQTEAYLMKIAQDRNLDLLRMTTVVVSLVVTMLVLLLCAYLAALSSRSQKLKAANQLFHAAINALPYPFHIIDVTTHKILIANSMTSVTGKPVEGLSCYAVTHGSAKPCDDPQHPCPITLALQQQQSVVVEHIHRNQDGEERVVEVHGHPIIDADGGIRQCIEYSIDVTERNTMQEQLLHLADTDGLTGVWNRRKFYELFAGELQRATRYSRPLSLLMLDIDHFKQVNDTFGHDVGDSVLVEMVQLLKSHLRTTDILARSGGEEFLVLVPETTLENARHLAEKLLQAVRKKRFIGADSVRLSIGIATYQCNDTVDMLVKRADQQLYRAKSKGRDRWEG